MKTKWIAISFFIIVIGNTLPCFSMNGSGKNSGQAMQLMKKRLTRTLTANEKNELIRLQSIRNNQQFTWQNCVDRTREARLITDNFPRLLARIRIYPSNARHWHTLFQAFPEFEGCYGTRQLNNNDYQETMLELSECLKTIKIIQNEDSIIIKDFIKNMAELAHKILPLVPKNNTHIKACLNAYINADISITTDSILSIPHNESIKNSETMELVETIYTATVKVIAFEPKLTKHSSSRSGWLAPTSNWTWKHVTAATIATLGALSAAVYCWWYKRT